MIERHYDRFRQPLGISAAFAGLLCLAALAGPVAAQEFGRAGAVVTAQPSALPQTVTNPSLTLAPSLTPSLSAVTSAPLPVPAQAAVATPAVPAQTAK
jgi:hypothetical protein